MMVMMVMGFAVVPNRPTKRRAVETSDTPHTCVMDRSVMKSAVALSSTVQSK